MTDCIGTSCKREGLQEQNAILAERIRVLREALEKLSGEQQRCYDAGWRAAAEWAGRGDLLADIDSAAYLVDRASVIRAG